MSSRNKNPEKKKRL
uniref:Uncharacterized protein n=1 Tax=Rhizophora mucronata TaxID=61149 RepID=A0A2P2ITL5_RHIMU